MRCVPASEASGSTEVAARAATEGSEQERLPVVLGGTQRGSREAAVGDVSTAASGASEERNERTAASRLGLWRCAPPIYRRFINN